MITRMMVRTGKLAEGDGKGGRLGVQLAHELLAVLRDHLRVLGGGARREARLADARQLLAQRLRHLQGTVRSGLRRA